MEAASLAWHPLGWKCAFVSEIEKAPCALLEQRYPDVPNFGDMTKFEEWPDVAIDLLAGGTPCQAFSVAGLRRGLNDPRGSLMLVYGAIAKRYRPTWLFWENVPGVLSSDNGRDFGSFLGMLAELGYGFAYRVLDAQFFGLAQRRARVFVVGYLGDWRAPAAVLFERESLRGDSPPRRETGEGIAPTIAARTRGGGGRIDGESETFIAHALTGEGFDASEDGTGRGTPIIPILEIGKGTSSRGDGPNGVGIGNAGDPMYTLQAGAQHAIAFDTTQITSATNRSNPKPGDPCHPVTAEGHAPAIAFNARQSDVAQYGDMSGPLDTDQQSIGVMTEWAVRRLTPLECERLQGAPEVAKHVILRVCSDLQNSAALAGTKSLRSPQSAWNADGRVLALRAPNADRLFNTPLPALAKRAAAHVRIDLEAGEVLLRNASGLSIAASIADAQGRLGLAVPGDAFVRLAVHMTSILASETRTGAVGSLPNTPPSTPRLSGSGYAVLCGRETSALAADAARLTSAVAALKSTTSEAGRDSLTSGWTSATSSFCVAAAMNGCIPAATRDADFYDLSVEVVGGYTLITYRGKPMADGPRYKMIGNSWAVPCVRWIGERIALVDSCLKAASRLPRAASAQKGTTTLTTTQLRAFADELIRQ